MIAILQALLTAVACGLLFFAWRSFRGDRLIALLVTAGFILRAALGQALFWISYLELPLGRGLQSGDGFWFFAEDGKKYFRGAVWLVDRGLQTIVTLDPSSISPLFTSLLAIAILLFGTMASVGLLINLAAFLGTSAIVLRLAGERKQVAAFAVGAISLSPSSILWSAQPLKDVVFLFLVTAFVAVARVWISAWREERVLYRGAVATLSLLAVLAAIGGIRWYFAILLAVASVVILGIAVLRAHGILPAMALAAVTLIVLPAIVYTAGPYVPRGVRRLILAPTVKRAVRSPRMLVSTMNDLRFAFDMLGGGTKIEPSSDTPGGRIAGGAAILVLPRALARATGLVDAGGGRGLWAFADLDTLFFDLCLIVSLLLLLRARQDSPLLWIIALTTIAAGVLFVYCVTNFGALFRYRSMIFIGLVLMPVVAPLRRHGRTMVSERCTKSTESSAPAVP